MEAVVSHIRMDVAGGAEYMTALMVNLLHRMGFNVTLVTGTPFDRKQFSNLSGIYIDDGVKVRTVSLTFDKILTPTKKAGNALLTIYRSRLLKEVVANVRPRIVLTDDEVFEALHDMGSYYGYLIHYVHFPYDNILNLYDLDSVRQRYKMPSRLALDLYARWAKKHIILQNFSDMVIANSQYTRSHCLKIWKRDDIQVLYPSITTSAFSNSEKEKSCIVIGRIAPDKNIGPAVRAFSSPKLQGYKLIIAGQIIDQYERYAQGIIDESKKTPNIQVVPNPSKDRLKELLSSAKVLLHPRRGEHFGLAIVEGMASGCIPVVHRSGGPLEIIDEGKYGFTFTNDNDMVDALVKAFEAPPSSCAASIERARQFDTSVFEERFAKVIQSVA
jgi:glycosyltransferase involved in cell wall biosynthesis